MWEEIQDMTGGLGGPPDRHSGMKRQRQIKEILANKRQSGGLCRNGVSATWVASMDGG